MKPALDLSFNFKLPLYFKSNYQHEAHSNSGR